MKEETTAATKSGGIGRRICYAIGNFGQSAFYNALSTYFVVYVTSTMFAGVDKALATKLIGIITGLIVAIRIGEIFIDPLLVSSVINSFIMSGMMGAWRERVGQGPS